MQIAEQLPDHACQAMYHALLARLALFAGERQQARQAYERVRAIRERLAAQEPDLYAHELAGILKNLAMLCEQLGEQSKARHFYRRTARWARRSPGLLEGAGVLDTVGAHFVRHAHTERAQRYGGSILDMALDRGEGAIARLSQGEDSQLDLHKRRLETAYTHGVYQAAGRNGSATGRLFDLLESLRQVERRSLEAGLDPEDDRPARLETSLNRAEAAPDRAALERALAAARRRRSERRAAELEALAKHKAALLYLQPTPRGVVLHFLSPEGRPATAVAPVRFGRLMDALFLLILRLPRFGRRGAQTVYRRIAKPAEPFTQRVYGLAAEAWAVLQHACPEVAAWLEEDSPRLWLNPHGAANRWPIELLNDGRRFLGLRWPLPRVAGLRGLLEALDRQPRPGSSLVVGDPTADLPAAKESARDIHERLRQVSSEQGLGPKGAHALLIQEDARRAVLLPTLAEKEAQETAAVPGLADPDLSFFLFTGHGGPARSGAVAVLAGEGTLSCTDLTSLRWPKQPWAHLDCCHGGYERYSGGGRLDGLTYAALTAGASAVLAAHHSVGDADTATFAEVFYERWLRQGDPAAKALLAARQELFARARHDVLLWALPLLHGNASVRSPWPRCEKGAS